MKPLSVFSKIHSVNIPESISVDPGTYRSKGFQISFQTDGEIPFPQVIIREHGREHLYKDAHIDSPEPNTYIVSIPAGELPQGTFQVQIEGCCRKDFHNASGDDWVKSFGTVSVAAPEKQSSRSEPSVTRIRQRDGIKVYFGIHKHMHQPYYRAAAPGYWDGEKDGIFGSRCGAYTSFIPDAVWQYVKGGLPHAGVSASWSGSLIEQLNRCKSEGLCGGCFRDWNGPLREIAPERTKKGAPRVGFTLFGFYHPLMPLIPPRNIIKQIELHRKYIRDSFGVDCIDILFPPETAFHVRMIPALVSAGVRGVIYDSIHRFRSCKEYPYAGPTEGMLPPNAADQENPAVNDWFQLHNIWAGSKISPSMLKPEYLKYEDPNGKIHKIIGIPAERYIGNEDARGGYGALQYEDVFGQVYENIVEHNSFDPAHPPFFLLHSDGDNHGGGADSYYRHNTGRLVEWLKHETRFELTTIQDYLDRFPPNESNAVHIEGGAWSGADNGDPQFRKWFSRYEQQYSPDLNSWAVLTAIQNVIHSLEDMGITDDRLTKAQQFVLRAETSCYWYWTGQELWDKQVTEAANAAFQLVKSLVESTVSAGKDPGGPTIFPPWVTPENPGGKTWGQGGLQNADPQGIVHTFIYDISGLKSVNLIIRDGKTEKRFPMQSNGTYPSETGPAITATYFTAGLPVGAGTIQYFIEAIDTKGNKSLSSLEGIHLA
jgi:hypothetical protein